MSHGDQSVESADGGITDNLVAVVCPLFQKQRQLKAFLTHSVVDEKNLGLHSKQYRSAMCTVCRTAKSLHHAVCVAVFAKSQGMGAVFCSWDLDHPSHADYFDSVVLLTI